VQRRRRARGEGSGREARGSAWGAELGAAAAPLQDRCPPTPPLATHSPSPRRRPLTPPPQFSGSQNAEFVRFSSGALARAQSKLNEFLGLMPRDALATARQIIAAEAAPVGDDE
jgi:hypothetical protein